MADRIEISAEIRRLAQQRTGAVGSSLQDELARNVVVEAVFALDPELDLVVDDEASYSQNDALVAAFGVNDVVVNGCRLDVRIIDEEGRVPISRALVGTSYLRSGTLVVRMDGSLGGTVVGYISREDWLARDRAAGDELTLYLSPKLDAKFDLATNLTSLVAAQPGDEPALPVAPEPFDLATFIVNRSQLIPARQRQIVEATLRRQDMWEQVENVVSVWSRGSVRRMLAAESVWNQRLERVTDILAARFKRLSKDDIRKVVAKLGETYGGQPESPQFRKAILSGLTREELSHSLGGAILKKATAFADEILSGRSANEAIKDFAKNRVAVDLAVAIKNQRKKVGTFMDATAEELSGAFQQLALQPVYSTHSQDPQAGVEAINEALTILEAGDIARQAKEAEDELAKL